MKSHLCGGNFYAFFVTSYAEVWIEIAVLRAIRYTPAVTSYAEVWIEIADIYCIMMCIYVTSYAEVWIEIVENVKIVSRNTVTSYAEVWIEILVVATRLPSVCPSPPTRRCGLKSWNQFTTLCQAESPPTRRCGLKFHVNRLLCDCCKRHLLRGGVD